ncbi:vitronectin [Suncus etruscus]|uniref:vitronectin n=1 Tax=Suncus etruscus TaxID=109475 RepID=UPI00210FFD0D|nr:vitronectin [Suncus etruscus]
MATTRALLVLALLAGVVLADQDSCKGRCIEGFNKDRKCQCDELCSYYQSCCADYIAECKPQVTRGDVFTLPEDEYSTYDYETSDNISSTHTQPESDRLSPTSQSQPERITGEPTLNPEEEAFEPSQVTSGPEEAGHGLGTTQDTVRPLTEEELCSGKPFDAFTELKNGSIFAFRGKYCYELDETTVRPGYPKLIRDVWGIEGPIDAAFTRVNCQGKTYLFKGSEYWRFEDGVLDPDYPRDISEGFSGIPDDVDAALALPAHSYTGQEKAYFFKGKQYWEYEFQQQPTQEDCEDSSQSAVFTYFAQMQRDRWDTIFERLFWGHSPGGAGEPMLISEGWRGLPEQVDAAMAGRIYISGLTPRSLPKKPKWKKKRNRKRYRSHRSRNQKGQRKSRSILSRFWLSWPSSEESDLETFNYGDYGDYSSIDWLVSTSCEPIQSIYFFSGDKYYRANLRTKQVDTVTPPYPRSIDQFWLDCPAPGHQ